MKGTLNADTSAVVLAFLVWYRHSAFLWMTTEEGVSKRLQDHTEADALALFVAGLEWRR